MNKINRISHNLTAVFVLTTFLKQTFSLLRCCRSQIFSTLTGHRKTCMFQFEKLSSLGVVLTSVTLPCRRSGFPAILPRGAAQPAAEGGDRPRGGLAGLHQRLAGRPALPQGEGAEKPRGRRHPVRYTTPTAANTGPTGPRGMQIGSWKKKSDVIFSRCTNDETGAKLWMETWPAGVFFFCK